MGHNPFEFVTEDNIISARGALKPNEIARIVIRYVETDSFFNHIAVSNSANYLTLPQ